MGNKLFTEFVKTVSERLIYIQNHHDESHYINGRINGLLEAEKILNEVIRKVENDNDKEI